MSLWDTIRGYFTPVEERTLTYQQAWGTDQDERYWTSLTASGENVTVESAMKAAVGKCVRLLADDISSLPVDVYSGQTPVDLPRWMVSPTGQPTDLFMSYISDWVTSQGMDGNSFTLALPNVFAPEYVEVLDPVATEVLEDRPGQYRLPNGQTADSMTVLHVPWVRLPGKRRGVSPVKSSKESIGLELAAQRWVAAYFKNAGQLGGIVRVPGGPETVDAEKLRAQFASRHTGSENWWKPAVLTGGAEYDVTTTSPKDAELGPLWTHVLEEAMGLFHIPPHLLSVIDTGAAARASVEERGIGYVRHAVRPFTTRFERSHSLMLMGRFVRLNLNGLMRGDAKTRGEFYQIMTGIKAMKPSYVAQLEDLPPDQAIEGWLETPNNNGIPVREPAPEPERMAVFEAEVRSGLAELRGMSSIPQPIVNNHYAPPEVTVHTTETTVNVPTPEVRVENTIPVPEVNVAAPVVNVEPPEVRVDAPTVTVNTPDTIRIAAMPKRVTKRSVTSRNDVGQIEETTDTESDA